MIKIIIGTSGTGKTTFANYIFGEENSLVSITSRDKRYGEIEGKDYYYVDRETFESQIESKKVFEYTEYANNYYGLTIDEVKKQLKNPKAFVIIDYNGAKQLIELLNRWNESYIILYFQADYDIIKERMTSRGDSLDSIQKRLKQYYIDEENNKTLLTQDNVILINANLPFKEVVSNYKYISKL